jgi:hypothetical protein
MSTVPVTPTPVATATKTWLQLHERIVCLALVLAFGCFGVSKYYDHEATVKQAQATAAAQVAAADAVNSKKLADQSQQVAQQYAALIQTLSAENASLNSAMTQRAVQQKTQINVDTNLPMAGVSARWTVLLPTVTPTAPLTGGLSLTAQQAHDSLVYMEQVPVLLQDLKDETAIAGNYQAEVQKSDLLNADLNAQVTGLQKENTDLVAKDKADVAQAKAEGRKGKIKYFKIGFVSGFLAGLWGGHAGL